VIGVLKFSRVVSQSLLDAVRASGWFGLLLDRVARTPAADLQLRRDGGVSGATLYLGLTAALTLQERAGAFRLQTHATHRAAADFEPAWGTWQPKDVLARHVGEVDAFLDRLLTPGAIANRWISREGAVQAALSRPGKDRFGIIQREAEVRFATASDVNEATTQISERMWNAVKSAGRSDAWWPGVRDRGKRPGMGRSVDLLGSDSAGRLAVIEVKPAAELAKIPWAAAQVGLYSELFAAWLRGNPDARTQLGLMAEQRHELGLLDERWCTPLAADARVAPIVAIGGGKLSPDALPRLAAVAGVLAAVPSSEPGAELLDPLEVWLCSDSGFPDKIWLPSESDPPSTA